MKYFIICKKYRSSSKAETVIAVTESTMADHIHLVGLNSDRTNRLLEAAQFMEFGEKYIDNSLTMYCLDTEIFSISSTRTSILLFCNGEPDGILTDYWNYTFALYAEDHHISSRDFDKFLSDVRLYYHYKKSFGEGQEITGISVPSDNIFLS